MIICIAKPPRLAQSKMLCHLPKQFYVIGTLQHVHQTSFKKKYSRDFLHWKKRRVFVLEKNQLDEFQRKGYSNAIQRKPSRVGWLNHPSKKKTLLNLLNLASNLPEKKTSA